MNIEEILQLAKTALEDLKATDITEIDVRGKTSMTDFMLIASGTSSRHVKSIAHSVVEKFKELGKKPFGVEGESDAEWVLVDMGDVVVHVMQAQIRDFYQLEKLWTMDRDADSE